MALVTITPLTLWLADVAQAKSRDAAQEIARLGAELNRAERPYLLIGVGRWGSRDPWLGIPVTWDDISGKYS